MIQSKRIQRPQLVLVVDDQEINRDVLEMILEDDYDILLAEDGRQALQLMYEHAGDLSIVLLDLMMPVMNGYEVLEHVRGDAVLSKIPIIVLTADKSAELQALELGAADFITKPFDTHEVILARVGRIIELSEGRKLISAAEHDTLTTLYTKNFFFEYANRLFRYHPELHMDALVINIEQFHSVNAVHGYEFGDKVLQAIGARIRASLQSVEGIAGRFEADDFVIYRTHHDDYRMLLSELQDAVNGMAPDVNVQLRMGICLWVPDVEPVLLFDRARAACNMVRGNYQNPIMVYDDEMLSRELLNQRLLNDLRAAIDERQFRVYYQPKYDVRCDPPKLTSAEALIRWVHPELGMVSPGQFIPLFEGNGLISMVDSYVWQEAARQVAEWKRAFGITLPVSVNLSRADMFDPTLSSKLEGLVRTNDLGFSDLKLEVTESAYTDSAQQMIGVINNLREAGFQIEMDDFGSGYSSLNMLSEMPIDVLKMDMRFVRDIEDNETDRHLVTLILDIAKYLGVLVVAEGVETRGQLNILRDSGCDVIQGFYFSRPLPPEEFEELIRKELQTERN